MEKLSQQERRKQDRERLESAVRELMSSEGWERWVATRSQFHRYSLNNQMLIAMQCPEASQVAGYKTWQKLGRQVVKGSKGIKILAPCTSGKRECPDCGVKMVGSGIVSCPKCGLSSDGPRMFFRSVSVFDVSQTEGPDLPEIPYAPLEGDSHAAYLTTLEGYAAELGYSVTYQETGEKGGWCDSSAKSIVVSESKSPNAKVRTLIHEVAHAHGVGYRDYGRQHAEVIVEAVTAIVCRGLGLDTSGESLPYIASWGSGSDLDALKKFAGVVDSIATKIEQALGLEEVKQAA